MSEKKEHHIWDFYSSCLTMEQTFVTSLNAGQRPEYQQRIQLPNVLSVANGHQIVASVSINYFVNYGNNIDCYSINTIFSCLIPRTQAQLLLSSTTESSQTIANVSISFADPHQGWETVFKVHLRSQLPNVISKCLGSCDKFITSKEWLLVNSYSSSTWRDPKTQE